MRNDGGSQMQLILSSDATIQGLVFTFLISTVTTYAIFNQMLIPRKLTDDSGDLLIDTEKATINHFPISSEGGSHPVIDLTRQVSCRAYTEQEARVLQDASFSALNRVKSSDSKVFFVADKMPIITPQNSADNYNAPLNVRTITVR